MSKIIKGVDFKMKFDKGQAVRIDLSKSSKWQSIFADPELCAIFSDGRLFGKIAEYILTYEFENLTMAPEGGSFDIEMDGFKAIEVKSLTKGGFDTSPSSSNFLI